LSRAPRSGRAPRRASRSRLGTAPRRAPRARSPRRGRLRHSRAAGRSTRARAGPPRNRARSSRLLDRRAEAADAELDVDVRPGGQLAAGADDLAIGPDDRVTALECGAGREGAEAAGGVLDAGTLAFQQQQRRATEVVASEIDA